jgi:hypothetical protein
MSLKSSHCKVGKVGQARGLRGTLSPALRNSPPSSLSGPAQVSTPEQLKDGSLPSPSAIPPKSSLTQALSMIYPPSSRKSPESPVQHPNLPYNQGNQQFDGRQW